MPLFKNSFYYNRTFFFLFHRDTFRISGCRQQSVTLQSLDFCQFLSVSQVVTAVRSVPGLVLVVPSVKVVVEENDASRRHASYDAPLVIGYGHGADSCVTAWVGEQLFEVVDLPDRNHTSISTCQQILTITTEEHCLDAVLHLHVAQKFAVDAEEAELSLVVVDHAVSLGR